MNRFQSFRQLVGAAAFAIVLAASVVIVRAEWWSNNPFGTTTDGGDVMIWVDWSRNPAVAAAELRLDESTGQVYVATWVVNGGGSSDDYAHPQSGAFADHPAYADPYWCGVVTARANFYYINAGSGWEEIETWRPASVDTDNCW